TFTSSSESFATRPRPLHFLHRSVTTCPVPPQLPHVRATVKKPCWKRICPRPWHCGHVVGALPPSAPLPLQSGHTAWRFTLTCFVTPKMDSSNVSSRSKRRSSPRCARERRRPPIPPPPPKKSPNRSPKISVISMLPSKPLPPKPFPTPACPKRS